MLKEIKEKIKALEIAKSCGIISFEDAEQQLKMNIEKYIKETFENLNVELKIAYLESNNMYRVRIPKKIQTVYFLNPQYFGASEAIVLKKIYDDLEGKKIANATLEEVFEKWRAIRIADPDVANDTVNKDRQYFEKWLAGNPLSNKPMRAITVQDLHTLFKSITEGRQLTKSRFNNFKSMLNILFDYAVICGAIEHNVAREIRAGQYKCKPSKNSISDVYTTDEINQLWKYMIEKNTIYSLACALSFCLGCRIGEIKALKWSDIDFNRRIISINSEVVTSGSSANQQALCEHTKSGLTEGSRELPFFDDGLLTLLKIKELAIDENFLFLGKTGKFILTQEVNDNIKTACKELGIIYRSSHKVRKWAATEACRQGMDEVSLMYTFGWKDRQTAQHYIKAGRTQQQQLAVLSKVFAKNSSIAI